MSNSGTEELSLSERSRLTLRYDTLRQAFQGILEAGFKTYILLIAIRVFHMGAWEKSLLSSAGFAGLLCAPLVMKGMARTSWTSMQITALYFFLVAACFLIASLTQDAGLYLVLLVAARFIYKQQIPLMIDVYSHNYAADERGSKLGFSMFFLATVSVFFSLLAGQWLDRHLDAYRWILVLIALSALGSALSFLKIPSRRIPSSSGHRWANLSLLWKDKLFTAIVLIWALEGIANQMTIPLRVEYIAHERYGLNFSNHWVTLLSCVIPSIFRILGSPLWGYLFDRLSLVQMKLWINSLLLLGTLAYFFSSSLLGILIGSCFIGMAHGGGVIAWSLWVTKIVPEESCCDYLSLSAAEFGLRSFISPFIGYALLEGTQSLPCVVAIAVLLISLSSLGFWLIRHHERLRPS
ncbi:MAG: MFS transporter [Puniceicoccales bacterium]|nr:MFS transporter [Puniceicoccales bacterium]